VEKKGRRPITWWVRWSTTLADAGLFTFQPHIHAIGGRWGFKHEDIYYMDANGPLAVLEPSS
jgi:hypothetical protein